MADSTLVKTSALREFCEDIFTKLGVPGDDAVIITDVLISADLRGVASHGVQRLKRYVLGLQDGTMQKTAKIVVLNETPTTLHISGGDGMGQVISYQAMNMVIEKAKENNIAFASVCDSNHYGIAGYYAMMALEHDMIGISLTNTAPLVTPTFSRDAILGTNPIAVAIPAGKERPFVMDMATSTVPRGKLEVYHRQGKKMPLTWATDETGNASDDTARVLTAMNNRLGGGLLPLGGAGEESSGYKGYGLCLLVDILCGVLAGSAYGKQLYSSDSPASKVSHFFGAMKIDAFINPDIFKKLMDEYIQTLKNSSKVEGQERVYIHGEKEYEILNFAQENNIDLIMLNSRKTDMNNPIQGWGTISHKVGILSQCPVMLVK